MVEGSNFEIVNGKLIEVEGALYNHMKTVESLSSTAKEQALRDPADVSESYVPGGSK